MTIRGRDVQFRLSTSGTVKGAKRSTFAGWLALVLTLLASLEMGAIDVPVDGTHSIDWLDDIRPDRPRMFLNADTLPLIREFARTHEGDHYQSILERVEKRPLVADPAWAEGANPGFGRYAQEAAFVWLMEGDNRNTGNNPGLEALEKAKNYLKAAVDFYHDRIDQGEAVNWYSASRVSALTAYDWIHDELSEDERRYFIQRFIRHHEREMAPDAELNRLSRGGPTRGFYGPGNLPWYMGLAFFDDPMVDAYAREKLIDGYAEHMELLRYRAQAAGANGGSSSVSTGYGFQMYPWSEINFIHTFNSSTGRSIEDEYDSLSLFPEWVLWNWIPASDGARDFGLGDAPHSGNHFMGAKFLEMHMLQIAHFFGDTHPDRAALALWIRQHVLEDPETHDPYWWPLAPFFAYQRVDAPPAQGPDASWPVARWFPEMGTVFMKSGWTSDDTHAVFVVDGGVNAHRHFDQGHFTIYHKGFQAIDSGTYGNRRRTPHLTEYLVRTVAHNSILIHAPVEADSPPEVWGGLADTLDGGQYQHDGKLLAFSTDKNRTYVSTDLTRAYYPAKADEVTRQFVFVPPDLFLIYDRVTTSDASYRQEWLLHTANQPQIDEGKRSFRMRRGEGVIVGRTLLPRNAGLEAVGGPGKEFWSAGHNWESVTDKPFHQLWGKWRLEVQAMEPRRHGEFLHVLRVGDASLTDVGNVKLLERSDRVGVTFERDAEPFTLWFNRNGPTEAGWGKASLHSVPHRFQDVHEQASSE